MTMSQATRTLLTASLLMLMEIGTVHAQAQRGRGAPQGAPSAIGRGGAAPAQTPPKPLIANAKPVRSCESLAMISLPNTTVESAAVDYRNHGMCLVLEVTSQGQKR